LKIDKVRYYMIKYSIIKFIRKIFCKLRLHKYENWSATCPFSVVEWEAAKNPFCHRVCRNCGKAMPKSRIYKNGIRGINSVEYNESKDFIKNKKEMIKTSNRIIKRKEKNENPSSR